MLLDTIVAWLHLASITIALVGFTIFQAVVRQVYALVPWPFSSALDCVWQRSRLLRKHFAYRLGGPDDAQQNDWRARGASSAGRLPARQRAKTTAEMLKEAGYGCEEHTVQTNDGYILGLQRIVVPPGAAKQANPLPGSAAGAQWEKAGPHRFAGNRSMGLNKEMQALAERLGLDAPEYTGHSRRYNTADLSSAGRGGNDHPIPAHGTWEGPGGSGDRRRRENIPLGKGARVLPAAPQRVLDPASAVPNAGRPPILLMHGLMQSSEAWLAPGLTPVPAKATSSAGSVGSAGSMGSMRPAAGTIGGANSPDSRAMPAVERVALPYLLAQAGYDVWLGNARGNRYSCAHVSLAPDDLRFWDFSIDGMAREDLPAMIGYVTGYTGFNKLAYVAFSQGTATMFAALSAQPALGAKLSVFAAMSPAISLRGLARSPVSTLLDHDVEFLYTLFGKGRMLGLALDVQKVLSPSAFTTCIDGALAYLFGWRMQSLDPLAKPALYAHLYSFTSVQTVVHWFSIIASGRFAMHTGSPLGRPTGFLYRLARSIATSLPLPFLSAAARNKHRVLPLYDTSHIPVPIGLWVGGKDTLISPVRLLSLLPSLSAPIPMPTDRAGTVLYQPGPGMPVVTLPTRYRDYRHFGSAAAAVYAAATSSSRTRRRTESRDGDSENTGERTRTGKHSRVQTMDEATARMAVGDERGTVLEGSSRADTVHPAPIPVPHFRPSASYHRGTPTLQDRALDAIASWVRGDENTEEGTPEVKGRVSPDIEEMSSTAAQLSSPALHPRPGVAIEPLGSGSGMTGTGPHGVLGQVGDFTQYGQAYTAGKEKTSLPPAATSPSYVWERHPPFLFVQPEYEHLDFQWALPTVAVAAWPAVVAFVDRYKHLQVQVDAPLPVRAASHMSLPHPWARPVGVVVGGDPLGGGMARTSGGQAGMGTLPTSAAPTEGTVGTWTPGGGQATTSHAAPSHVPCHPPSSLLHTCPSVSNLPAIRHAQMSEVEAFQGEAGPAIHRLRPGILHPPTDAHAPAIPRLHGMLNLQASTSMHASASASLVSASEGGDDSSDVDSVVVRAAGGGGREDTENEAHLSVQNANLSNLGLYTGLQGTDTPREEGEGGQAAGAGVQQQAEASQVVMEADASGIDTGTDTDSMALMKRGRGKRTAAPRTSRISRVRRGKLARSRSAPLGTDRSPHIGLNLSRENLAMTRSPVAPPGPLLMVEEVPETPPAAAVALHEPPVPVIDGSAVTSHVAPITLVSTSSGTGEGAGRGGGMAKEENVAAVVPDSLQVRVPNGITSTTAWARTAMQEVYSAPHMPTLAGAPASPRVHVVLPTARGQREGGGQGMVGADAQATAGHGRPAVPVPNACVGEDTEAAQQGATTQAGAAGGAGRGGEGTARGSTWADRMRYATTRGRGTGSPARQEGEKREMRI